MKHYVGLDISVKTTSICILDQEGNIVCEHKAIIRPDDLVDMLKSRTDLNIDRVGLEAGPLSQWLFDRLAKAGLPVICIETRHAKAFLKAQQVNKSDRNDARGIAQMMRVNLYQSVHVKTLESQKKRVLCEQGSCCRKKPLRSRTISVACYAISVSRSVWLVSSNSKIVSVNSLRISPTLAQSFIPFSMCARNCGSNSLSCIGS